MFVEVSGMNDVILKYIHEGTWASALALGGYVVMSPVRTVVNAIKERLAVLDAVKEELETQRTNCLSTLQVNSAEQLDVLKEVAKTLSDMHLDQRTLLGKLDK